MMSTGLTFGSISTLYGLTYGYVTQAQYSLLVTAVIGSAVIPTLIGQIWFYPTKVGPLDQESAGYLESTEHFLHMRRVIGNFQDMEFGSPKNRGL